MNALLLILLLGYWPLPANYGITGTFMEYRHQHIHAGFDLSTDGKDGLPVRCFDNGFIVLIKVQKRGYGRVLYIRHPKEKLVSVYGHLDRFSAPLEKIVSRYKRLRKTRYPGTIVPKHPIPVRKGQIIAYSGESGVGWPHLHFELRNLKNEPVNPEKYGFSVQSDKQAPDFRFLNIYPATPDSTVNGACRATRIPVQKLSNGNYSLPPFQISGQVFLSVTIHDTDGRKGPLAIYSLHAQLNNQPFYQYLADQFSYDRFKRSSAIYDLGQTRLSPASYGFNLFVIPGSNLSSQHYHPPRFKTGNNRITITTRDFAGNTAHLSFRFSRRKKTGDTQSQQWFTPSAALVNQKILKAASIRHPAAVTINRKKWTVVAYSTLPAHLKLGNVQIETEGYNASPMLLYVQKQPELPKAEGLLPVAGTGIEIQPGLIFLKHLLLIFQAEKINPQMGWFRYDRVKRKWKYRNSEIDRQKQTVTADNFKNGSYRLFLDISAPKIIRNPYFFRNRTAWHITDTGKGVDDSQIFLSRGKKKWKMEYDPDRKIAWIDKHLPRGHYRISVKDFAGNAAEKSGFLK
ncbi:MAG: M23 family metallopeptidase [Acidobacteria bacterium]|nr:M23 family metallopeptidase [Acidobacteriota bacterium]